MLFCLASHELKRADFIVFPSTSMPTTVLQGRADLGRQTDPKLPIELPEILSA